MTLTATTNRVQYSGDGATISFPITFIFWDDDDPQVTHADSAGTETTWTRGTEYTISGGSGSTGTLTVVLTPTDNTPASGETLTITSNLAFTQPTDLPLGGDLSSDDLEQQLDQIVRQIQQIDEVSDRSLKFPVSDASSLSSEIPNSTDRASARLGFDASGNPVAVTSDLSGVATTAFIDTLLDDSTAATARATLVAAGTTDENTFTKSQIWTKGSDVASAAALTLGDGNWFDITGTTAITSIGTVGVGTLIVLQFDGALILTHNATDLILPGGEDIVTVAGDIAVLYEYASADWRLVAYNANIPIHQQKSVDPSQKVTFFDDFVGDMSNPISSTAGSGAGVVAATISAGAGGRVTISSSTADGSNAANTTVLALDVLDWRADQGGLILETRLQIDDVSEAAIFVGFTDNVMTGGTELPIFKTVGADTIDSDATDACGIAYDIDGTTDEWFHGGVKAGTDTAATHSGSAPVDATYVTLRVEVSAAGAVEGFVDGTSIGAATASAITITAPLTPAICISNRSTNQVIATIDYLYVQANR